MALQCFVDAFNIGTAVAGSTVVRTGYGFQPKACLYWWTGRTESATTFARATLLPGLGMAVSPTSRACISMLSQDTVGTMVCASRQSNAAAIECLTTAKGLGGSADLQSFDAGGQTLVIDTQFGTNLRVQCLAIGGSDLTDAAVVEFQAPAAGALGLQDIPVAFQPTAVVLLSIIIPTTPPVIDGSGNYGSVGVATSASAQGVISWADINGLGTSANGRYGYGGECVALQWSQAAINQRATFVSFLATGFRLDWLENISSNPAYIWALCLRGGSMAVGNVVTSTTLNAPLVETGLGFAPTGVFFCSASGPHHTQDTSVVQATASFGAATSPSNRACQALVSNNAANNAVCASSVRGDACLQLLNSATVSAGIVDYQSTDSDGFTAVMDVADVTTQKYVTYLAVGDSGGPTAYALAVDAGSVVLTGTATTPDVVLAAASAALTLAGTASLPRVALAAASGSASLSGTVMTPRALRRLVGAAGSLTLTGTLSVPRVTLAAASGPVALTGTASLVALRLPVSAAVVTLAGTDATLHRAQLMSAAAGSTVLSGMERPLRKVSLLPTTAGTLTLTGAASTPRLSLLAVPGSLAVAGTLTTPHLMLPTAVGTLALTGLPATGRYMARALVDHGSVLVSGTDAGLQPAQRLSATPGSVSLSGTSLVLRYDVHLAVAAAPVVVAGTDATLTVTLPLTLDAAPGMFSLSGTAVSLSLARRVVAASGILQTLGTARILRLTLGALPGAVAVAGMAATPHVHLPSTLGSVALVGTAALLQRTGNLLSAPGTVALTGTAVTLRLTGHMALTTEPGLLTLTGAPALLRKATRLAVEPASVALAGLTTPLRVMISGEPGSVLALGTTVTLAGHPALVAAPGAVSLLGTVSTAHILLPAPSASVAVSGSAATLRYGQALRLSAETGSVALSAPPAVFARARGVAALPGSVILTGTPTTVMLHLGAAAGIVTLLGVGAALRLFRVLVTEPGLTLLAGQDAILKYGAANRLDAEKGVLVLAGTAARHGVQLAAASGLVAVLGLAVGLPRALGQMVAPGEVHVAAPSIQCWWSPQLRRRVVSPTEVHIVASDGTLVYRYRLLRLPQLRTYGVRAAPDDADVPTTRRLPRPRTYALTR